MFLQFKNDKTALTATLILFALGISILAYTSISRDTPITKNSPERPSPPKKYETELRMQNTGESIDEYVRNQMAVCYETGGENGCYKKIGDLFYDQFGLARMITTLEQNEKYPEVYARCHEVTHYLGRHEYTETKNIGEAFASCTSICHGGCFHGILEGYFDEHKEPFLSHEAVLARDISTICGKQSDYVIPWLYNECVHGIGHGAMFINDMDLLHSLKLCDLLPSGEKQTCYGGVFMENSSSATNQNHPTNYLRKDDLMYPCSILEDKYLDTCYRYQSSYFAELTHWDWQKTIDLCMQIPEIYRRGCLSIVGSNQVGYTQDKNVMRDNCKLAPTPALRNECVRGVMTSFGGRFINTPTHLIEFCSIVDKENKETCYGRMSEILSAWGLDNVKKKGVCENITDKDFVAACIQRN
ncbi:hypothetical protein HY967_04320 [Candidatus Jorgensenbacteria bacterium]|nr:hypothetical protein [Candidatus Jorgensenbacteria bacterium]